jgi:hypothetical protein
MIKKILSILIDSYIVFLCFFGFFKLLLGIGALYIDYDKSYIKCDKTSIIHYFLPGEIDYLGVGGFLFGNNDKDARFLCEYNKHYSGFIENNVPKKNYSANIYFKKTGFLYEIFIPFVFILLSLLSTIGSSIFFFQLYRLFLRSLFFIEIPSNEYLKKIYKKIILRKFGL